MEKEFRINSLPDGTEHTRDEKVYLWALRALALGVVLIGLLQLVPTKARAQTTTLDPGEYLGISCSSGSQAGHLCHKTIPLPDARVGSAKQCGSITRSPTVADLQKINIGDIVKQIDLGKLGSVTLAEVAEAFLKGDVAALVNKIGLEKFFALKIPLELEAAFWSERGDACGMFVSRMPHYVVRMSALEQSVRVCLPNIGAGACLPFAQLDPLGKARVLERAQKDIAGTLVDRVLRVMTGKDQKA